MPSTISDLFGAADPPFGGSAKWGHPIGCNQPGVYIVSLSPDRGFLANAPISQAAVKCWIARVPGLTIDGKQPTLQKVMSRLSEFWLTDEAILYIGQTTRGTLDGRIADFYRHKLGMGAPHCGGCWIKTLEILNELKIYWARSDKPHEDEQRLLREFAYRRTDSALPFANLRGNGSTKRHRLHNWYR